MGLSGSTKTTTTQQTTKPVYEGQIMGAYNGLNNAFQGNQGNLSNIQGLLSGLVPQAVGNYTNNAGLNAGEGWATNLLTGGYDPNPFQDEVLKYSNADVANGTNAALGTRGLAGGSVAAKIIAGQLAKNDATMRAADYANWQQRQAQAAGMLPAFNSARNANLGAAVGAGTAAANLTTDNAAKNALAVGGLLGQYTDMNGKQTEKTSGSLGSALGGLLSAASLFGGGGLAGFFNPSSYGSLTSAVPSMMSNGAVSPYLGPINVGTVKPFG